MLKQVIKENFASFTKAEKKIADYILQDRENHIIAMTLAELSATLGLGEATIVRFCRKVHCKGFQDMKFAIALEDTSVEADTEINTYLDLVENNMMNVLRKTKARVDLAQLEEAVELLAQSDHLYFFGLGSSGFIALMAEERLLRIGYLSRAIIENHMQYAQSALCNEKDTIVAISLSGTTPELYDVLCNARENRCRIIAITDHMNSPIAKISDCVLLTNGVDNPISGGTFTSMTSQIFIMDLLVTGYSRKHADQVTYYKEKVAASINRRFSLNERDEK